MRGRVVLGMALLLVAGLAAAGLRLFSPGGDSPTVDFSPSTGPIEPPFNPRPPPDAGPPETAGPCRGLTVAPGQDLVAVVAAQPAGARICLGPSVYRINEPITPNQGQVLVGRSGTVINGSRVISDWERAGSHWVASGQSQGPTVSDWSGPALVFPQALYGEGLFYDGEPLIKAGVKDGGQIHGRGPDTLGPGEYFFDYDSDSILLGSDPEGHLLEASIASGGIGGTATDVTVRGLVVEQTAGYGIDGNQGWTVENNEIRFNHTSGVGVSGFSRISHNHVHHNGKYGLNASGKDVVVDHNRVENNNLARFSTVNGGFWDAGGSKFVFTENLVVRGNWFIDNFGDGIWLDLNNSNAEVVRNRSSGNERFGVFVEISYGVSLRENYIGGNRDFGIFVNSSPEVDVFGNLVTGGVVLQQQRRGEGTLGPHVVQDSLVRDNVVDLSTGLHGLLAGGGAGDGIFSEGNNRFEGNTYYLTSRDADKFLWRNEALTVQQWVEAGLDRNGEFYVRRE